MLILKGEVKRARLFLFFAFLFFIFIFINLQSLVSINQSSHPSSPQNQSHATPTIHNTHTYSHSTQHAPLTQRTHATHSTKRTTLNIQALNPTSILPQSYLNPTSILQSPQSIPSINPLNQIPQPNPQSNPLFNPTNQSPQSIPHHQQQTKHQSH